MLSPRQFHDLSEQMGKQFTENPGDFVTETDLQLLMVSEIREAFSGSSAGNNPRFKTDSGSIFKQAYIDAVEDGYHHEGIDPVHTEVSLEKGERIDIGVFDSPQPTARWENGSKKFNADDFAALFELKFVKNRKKPPTTTGFKPYQERNNSYGQGTLNSAIDWEDIGVKADIEALGKRTSVPYRAVLVFSNFNYYYHQPTKQEVDHAPLYEDLGNAAQSMIQKVGNDMGVNVLYVAPELRGAGRSGGNCGGLTWIHEAI